MGMIIIFLLEDLHLLKGDKANEKIKNSLMNYKVLCQY